MGIIITLIGLHGVYFLFMGLKCLSNFISTGEIIYLYHSTRGIIGIVLFLSAIGLDSNKLISYYSTISVYCLLIIIRISYGISYFISNGFAVMEFTALMTGNILMAWICYYIFKKKVELVKGKSI